MLDRYNKTTAISYIAISEYMISAGLDKADAMNNFVVKRDSLSSVFMRIYDAAGGSDDATVSSHVCGVLATKLLDYIEDILLFATENKVIIYLFMVECRYVS